MGWDLVTLSPSDFVSGGFDRIEACSRDIFDHLMNLDKCVILMDEMDSLFRSRESLRNSPLEFVVPAFLPKLQRLRDYVLERRMAVFIITNYYEMLDSAISRGGRIDYQFLILPYSKEAKCEVIKRFLGGKWVENGVFTDGSREAIEKVFGRCPPLLVYREIEQIGKLVTKKCPDPAQFDETAFKGIDIIGTINPEMYKPSLRGAAFPEMCALIDRINNIPRKPDYLSLTEIEALDFFRSKIGVTGRYQEVWQTHLNKWFQHLNPPERVPV